MREAHNTNTIDLENKLLELQGTLDEEKRKAKQLADRIQDRQERYVRREQEYRRTIQDYENKLRSRVHGSGITLNDTTHKHLEKINAYHKEILDKITLIQHKTTNILQDQEQEIVKMFDEQLKQKGSELEEERKKKVEGIGTYSQREQRLLQELELRKASVEVLENTNKFLHKQNGELKVEFHSQENDKEILENQLNELKRRNERLRFEIQKYKDGSIEDMPQQSQKFPSPERQQFKKSKQQFSTRSQGTDFDATYAKYEAVVSRLKRMLELERKNLRAARTAYSKELQSKTELESILRECVEDVKSEITKKRSEIRLQQSDLPDEDLEKILEVLLSQERVLTLLYDKTFPPRSIAKEPLYENLDSIYMSNIEHIDENIGTIESMYERQQHELASQTHRAQMEYAIQQVIYQFLNGLGNQDIEEWLSILKSTLDF